MKEEVVEEAKVFGIVICQGTSCSNAVALAPTGAVTGPTVAGDLGTPATVGSVETASEHVTESMDTGDKE